ncbi:response regulator transcription factor [Bdellovibrio sp. HCB337]|uniref:response regulator transcription factor n=1 Tax=Bdellovibrio sp. HCB337 TaxID=3394358 RepID=UPI0039A4646B
MKDILYIEDSPELVLMVKETLKPHHVHHCSTLKDAETTLQQKSFDLILLDLSLPDGDGLRYLAAKISDQSNGLNKTPLFVLTGQSEISSKVMAFAIGVDDYIIKPFHHAELKARVEAKLRKGTEQATEESFLQLGNVRLDMAKQKVTVHTGTSSEDLTLTRLEFKMLTKFMKSPDRVFSRELFIETIWSDANVTDRTVDTHIAHLRKKIGPATIKIETVTGEGYRLKVIEGSL